MSLNSYPDKYLDVDFLTNSLYNFLYTETNREYLADTNYKNIDINDIKLSLLEDRQKTVINNIFNNKIKFSYKKQTKYVFKYSTDIHACNVTLQMYTDSEVKSLSSHENANSLITWILSELVVKGMTNGILLNIMTIDLNSTLLDKLIDKYPQMCDINAQNDDSKIIKCTIFFFIT